MKRIILAAVIAAASTTAFAGEVVDIPGCHLTPARVVANIDNTMDVISNDSEEKALIHDALINNAQVMTGNFANACSAAYPYAPADIDLIASQMIEEFRVKMANAPVKAKANFVALLTGTLYGSELRKLAK